jgi:hypothetical protein
MTDGIWFSGHKGSRFFPDQEKDGLGFLRAHGVTIFPDHHTKKEAELKQPDWSSLLNAMSHLDVSKLIGRSEMVCADPRT